MENRLSSHHARLGAVLVTGLLAACSGNEDTSPDATNSVGASSGGSSGSSTTGNSGSVDASFAGISPIEPNASADAKRCAPDNPYARDATGNLLPAYSAGTRLNERQWLASYLDEAYLWYKEIPLVDPQTPVFDTGTYGQSMASYFYSLLTPQKQADGQDKDRFSFIYPTALWKELTQTGVKLGHGVTWIAGSREPPRNIRVAMVQPGSNAEQVGLTRGDQLLKVTVGHQVVDVDDTTEAGLALLNSALAPKTQGALATLQIRGLDATVRDVTVTAGPTTSQPVLAATVLNTGTSRVGYLALTEFMAPAENQLITAFTQFSSQGVQDLVLDLRYNGGGYLYLASQLAYMIAGPSVTQGQVFERLVYNDKRGQVDTPFLTRTSNLPGSNTTANQPLPTLNLSRVTVLTQAHTCSASESVINGLRGIGVTVNLVGSTTCGKPYGFVAKDNCGLSYFPIEFQAVNARGEGDYASGMTANCQAADDLNHPLGDASEGMLAAALSYGSGGACPAAKSLGGAGETARLIRSPVEEGKFLLPANTPR